jgi:hypothetical protein
MTAEENKIFEDALLLQKTTTWWINKTAEVLDEIDRVERKGFSLARAKKLESLYKNLEVFLAKKRIEEDKITDILSRIDKIKDKKCQN